MATVLKNGNLYLVEFNDGTLAEFSEPQEKHLGLALAGLRKDPFAMADVIIDNCCISPNKDKFKNSVAYLRQINAVVDQLFDKVSCTLEATSIDGQPAVKVSWENGITVHLRICDRKTYSESRVKSQHNPLAGIKHVVNTCVLDKSAKINTGMYLGFSEYVEQFLDDTGERLGN